MSPTIVAPSKMPRVDYSRRSSSIHNIIGDESREEGDGAMDRRPLLPRRPSSIDPPGIPSLRNIQTLEEDKRQRPPPPPLLLSPRVSFDDSISVRLYNTVLGDNPSVRHGPPVSLGWVYTPEKRSMGQQQRPRNHKYCYLDTPTRIERLRNNGFSLPEMEDAVAEVQNLRDQRRNNLMVLTKDPVVVTTENRKRPLSPRNNNNNNNAEARVATSPRAKKDGFLPVSSHPLQQRHPWAANHHHNHHHKYQQPSRPHYYYYAIGTRTPPPPPASQQPFRLPTYRIPRRPPLQPIHPLPSAPFESMPQTWTRS